MKNTTLSRILPITILGATGKMGQRIIQLAKEDPRYKIVGGTTRHRSHGKHKSASLLAGKLDIPLTTAPEEAMADCQVAIDFSSKSITKRHIHIAETLGKGLVIGTTGLDQQTLTAMEHASAKIPILYSPNFSLGIALCRQALRTLSATLWGESYIDIIETHHIHKKDRPSGTAIALAEALGKRAKVVHAAKSKRRKDEIVIHTIRTGNVIGEHTVVFECEHERITLTHHAHSRDLFAQGALLAAKFIADQAPGLYSMEDLLHLA